MTYQINDRVIVSMRYRSRRFFIGMGFPGFNSPANNRFGYATPESALAASLRYERKGIARQISSQKIKSRLNG